MREDQENLSQPTKKDNEKLPETPVSGDRKLTIKLKIANLEKRIEEDRINPQGNSQSKVCTVCNKEFSSGQALGGHIKVHFHDDNNKQQSLKKLKTHHKKPINKIQNPQWVVDFYKNRDSNEATNESLVGNGKQIVCLLCEKKFSSMKALFGHMRSHPERERKGIAPSLAAKNSPSSSVSESMPHKIDGHIDTDAATMGKPETDLMESLPRWPVTARRNPRVVVATLEYSSSEEEAETMLFYGAVDELIRLAHGNSFNSGLTHNDRIEEYEATNHSSLTNKAEIGNNEHRVFESNKPRIEASPVKYREDYHVKKQRIEGRGLSNDGGHIGVVPKNMDKGKEKAVLESENSEWVDAKDWNREVEDYMNCTDDESHIKDTEDLCRVQLMNYKCERTSPRSVMISSKKIKRKRNEVNLRDLEVLSDGNLGDNQTEKPIVTRTPNKYQCSTCDRCYSTKQALGGHMSYHKRDKNFQNTIDESSSSAPEDEHHPNPISGVGEKFVESTHQCEICNRTLLTGQALGGHKRFCHLSTSPASSRAASPGEASQTGRRILGFDLNEPPPMDDEEC